jgi:hypothetical protein
MIVVTTAWIGDGRSVATAYRPAIADDHPGVTFPEGIYGNASDGPTVQLAECDANTLAAIQANAKYVGKVADIAAKDVAAIKAARIAGKTALDAALATAGVVMDASPVIASPD